jgi:DNA repair protein SbcD/Mre11
VYPGSIERIDFGEEHEDKGCVLVELERGHATWRFHKLAARPFVTIDVDVRNSSDPQARVATAIEKQALGQAVVRVQIEATQEQAALLRIEEIQQLLEAAGAFQIAAIATEVERASRGRLAGSDRNILNGLTPRKALELYLRSKNTAEDRIAALLEAAEELFAEQG